MNNKKHEEGSNGYKEGQFLSNVDLIQSSIIKDRKIQISYLRAERIAAAAHLITSDLSDSEPLKKGLRESSLSLLNFFELLICQFDGESFDSEELIQLIEAKLLGISSMLSISLSCGYISEAVASVLQQQLGLISRSLHQIEEKDSISLPSSFFDIDFDGAGLSKDSESGSEDQIEKTMSANFLTKGSIQDSKSADSILTKKAKRITSPKEAKKTSQNKKANTRREAILVTLKRHGEMSLKDISEKIGSNYSQKTLQRDLASLSKDGLVLKKGSKRWSTYVLKDTVR